MTTQDATHSALRGGWAIRRALPLVLIALLLGAAVRGEGHVPAAGAVRIDGLAIATTSASSDESEFVRLLNDARVAHGLKALVVNYDIVPTSRTWSSKMRSAGTISHDPNLGPIITQVLPSWTRAGENVGVGYSVKSLHDAFWNSAGHRANMLGDFNQVGIGVQYSSDGRIWVTVRFAKGKLPATRADRVGTHRANAFYLRKYLSAGGANISYSYGASSDRVVMGDWNGDGVSTPALFRNGVWYLRNSNSNGSPALTFTFGQAGDTPLAGDWNGDGVDTIGVWRAGRFLLRNGNSAGTASIDVTFGSATDRPLVGDWDGNHTDTIGYRHGATFYLRNASSAGSANITFTYGDASDVPMVGDWDGNGTDTPGVRRSNVFYLRNSNSGGGANISFGYGSASDQVLVGGW